MSILKETKEDFTYLIVDSETLTGDKATELKTTVLELIDSGITKISLDLKNPEYIDSSGIGKLLFINKKMEKINGIFSIHNINQTLYDFLESLAITRVINITPPSSS